MSSEHELATREIQLHIPDEGITNDLLSSFESSTNEMVATSTAEDAASGKGLPRVVAQYYSEQEEKGVLEHKSSPNKTMATSAAEEATASKGLSRVVAQHYNQQEEKGRSERKSSRIFHMRNLNNWIKSRMIGNALDQVRADRGGSYPVTVLDLGCGKGGDLLKWERGNIEHIVCADIAATSIEHCKERYSRLRREKGGRVFSAQFVAADCTKVELSRMLERPDLKIDLVSCQFALHYSFESLPQAEQMLANITSNLQPGGYFIGTTTDAYDIIRRLNRDQDPNNRRFGNEVFSVEFPAETPLDPPPLFGARYNFHLQQVVDCPEFLVHFPTFVKLAARYGLRLLKKMRFEDFVDQELEQGRDLLWKMKALETYNPSFTRLVSSVKSDYAHTAEFFEAAGDSRATVGTLSKAEWEAVSLYLMFVFRKEEISRPDQCINTGMGGTAKSAQMKTT